MDDESVMYGRQTGNKHQLVVPKTLIHHIIEVNHDPVYVEHPGSRGHMTSFRSTIGGLECVTPLRTM